VRNAFQVTKESLNYEITNAMLMVSIKNNLNDKEDVKLADERIAKLTLTLNTDADGSIQKEIDELKSIKSEAKARVPENDKLITALKKDVTKAKAKALTIESDMFTIESGLRLEKANDDLASLDELDEELRGEV
jgi:hypothetical protein